MVEAFTDGGEGPSSALALPPAALTAESEKSQAEGVADGLRVAARVPRTFTAASILLLGVAASLLASPVANLMAAGSLGTAKGMKSKGLLDESSAAAQLGPPAEVVVVVPAGMESGFGPTWEEVYDHISNRITWAQENIRLSVFTDAIGHDVAQAALFKEAVRDAKVLQAIHIEDDPGTEALLLEAAGSVEAAVFLDSSPALTAASQLGGFHPAGTEDDAWTNFLLKLPFATAASRGTKAYGTIQEYWGRKYSDDFLYALLLLVDQYTDTNVPLVGSVVRESSLKEISCMLSNCFDEVTGCVRDKSCKAGLDCLEACPATDQICSYRCIVSYESPLLEAFSLCILQRHNCLGATASIPSMPDPSPLASFRGAPMTHDLAKDLFVGHLEGHGFDELSSSWRVVAGKNPAYDYFPCQYQLFYRGRAKNVMWYDPVFRVKTLDGRDVWRRRHYRVRTAEEPGTFYFSVLDNGVISNEYWRIVDVQEDMSWALFYYSGAASAAGISYEGAVLVTNDGQPVREEHAARVAGALERCGIKEWELSSVDNSECVDAPLSIAPGDITVQQVALPAM